MPNTKEKGKLIEILSKHIPYGHATLCLIAEELIADGVRLEEKRATSDGCITMDVHGKLMGLLQRAPYIRCEDVHRQYAVNWLMNNGVTVQERIPSYDYPKETGFYNCYYKTPDSNLWRVGMCYWNDTNWIQVGFMPVAVQVMFYMPLPQPPKGE